MCQNCPPLPIPSSHRFSSCTHSPLVHDDAGPGSTMPTQMPTPSVNIYYIFDHSNQFVYRNSFNTTNNHTSQSFNVHPRFSSSSSPPFVQGIGKVMWQRVYVLHLLTFNQTGQTAGEALLETTCIDASEIHHDSAEESKRHTVLHSRKYTLLITTSFDFNFWFAGFGEGPNAASSGSSPSIPMECSVRSPSPIPIREQDSLSTFRSFTYPRYSEPNLWLCSSTPSFSDGYYLSSRAYSDIFDLAILIFCVTALFLFAQGGCALPCTFSSSYPISWLFLETLDGGLSRSQTFCMIISYVLSFVCRVNRSNHQWHTRNF